MEVWLSVLIGLLSIAVTIGIGAWQLSRAVERVAERVTMAIHEDIRHCQEKLEGKIEKRQS